MRSTYSARRGVSYSCRVFCVLCILLTFDKDDTPSEIVGDDDVTVFMYVTDFFCFDREQQWL